MSEYNRGSRPACAEDGNSKLGLERPFLDQFNKHVLQTEAPNLGKGLMSGKGIFLFPQETSCQGLPAHPRCFVKHLRSSTAAQNRVLCGEVAEWGPAGILRRGPLSSSHLFVENQICAQCSDIFSVESERALLLPQDNSDLCFG